MSKIAYDIKKTKYGRKIHNEVNLLLALYINRSLTKNFPIEKLLEMMDSSVESLGEVESTGWSKKKQATFYDNHKSPQGMSYTKMTAIFGDGVCEVWWHMVPFSFGITRKTA